MDITIFAIVSVVLILLLLCVVIIQNSNTYRQHSETNARVAQLQDEVNQLRRFGGDFE